MKDDFDRNLKLVNNKTCQKRQSLGNAFNLEKKVAGDDLLQKRLLLSF